MFPIEKYRFFTNSKDLVVAEQTYAGVKYRGYAKLADGDSFNYEEGKRLAALRCNLKICGKRYEAALGKIKFLNEIEEWYKKAREEAESYYEDSAKELVEAKLELNRVEISMSK